MILILRPEPGASATLTAARERGLEARAFPLFAVRPLAWAPPARAEVDALLLGSANALRHGGPALAAYGGLPAYCVGETTARAAHEAGLEVVATGHGGLQNLLAVLQPAHRRLLRLAGRERVTLDVPAHAPAHTPAARTPPARTEVILREVYASEALPMPEGLPEALAHPAPATPVLALLHSGEAAARFAQLVDQAGAGRAHIRLAAIGPRVAQRAGTGWATLRSAAQPNDAALLALAQEICQEPLPGQ